MCKKEFVHKYSDDPKKRKDQWRPGFGENLVHACLYCHTCGMAYCQACHLKKICNLKGVGNHNCWKITYINNVYKLKINNCIY